MKQNLINLFAVIGFGTFILFISSQTSDILLNGTVSAENNQIKNIADPTDDNDAVNKSFLDSNISSLTSNNGKYQVSSNEQYLTVLNTETGVMKTFERAASGSSGYFWNDAGWATIIFTH
tara:strand:- start:494 stop:853 length:360 start_codon:yes stop_codon:yes gene_type:complete